MVSCAEKGSEVARVVGFIRVVRVLIRVWWARPKASSYLDIIII
jgi:hypothetical protein